MAEAPRFSPAQKAAAVLAAIGKPHASALLKQFSKAEIRVLLEAAKGMNSVPQSALETVVGDFEREFTRGTGLIDSAEQISEIVTATIGEEEMAKMTEPEAEAKGDDGPGEKSVWEILAETEAKTIADLLATENPQVGAFVLARLSSGKAAEVLAQFGRTERVAVLGRMMAQGEVADEVAEFIEAEIRTRFTSQRPGASKEVVARVATILNELDKDVTEEAISDLSGAVADEHIASIRSMLFRFEDIIRLDATARATIFDAVQPDVLTTALAGADPAATEAALSAISQRSRRMIENDLKNVARFKPADILTARKQIVSRVLRLANDGTIAIPAPEQAAA